MMRFKKLAFTAILLCCLQMQVAQTQTNSRSKYQRGYYKPSAGTYVQPHYKTTPNKTNKDNYSTKYNSNSWTGKKGYRAQDNSPQTYNYGKGKTVVTGSRGGQYYRNPGGKKVYVPKRGK